VITISLPGVFDYDKSLLFMCYTANISHPTHLLSDILWKQSESETDSQEKHTALQLSKVRRISETSANRKSVA